MAKNGNTFEKRRREMEKKQQAEQKRARKRERNEQRPETTGPVFVQAPREDQ
jgi:hypothetical protein